MGDGATMLQRPWSDEGLKIVKRGPDEQDGTN